MSSLKWTIGEVEIFQIVEIEDAGRPMQEGIKEATLENLQKIAWLYPYFVDKMGKFKSKVASFLIKSNNKNILVDTCNGNNKVRTDLPEWANLHTDFLKRLEKTGTKEKDINIVISTHLHTDHVGWNTKLENRVWVPTFPNAKHLFVQKEYDYWLHKPEKEVADDKDAFDDSVTPIVKAGLAEFIPTNYRIDEHVSLLSTPGHSPGHTSILVESRKERTIISGDFLHHPCQIAHPEWKSIYDTFPDKAIRTRQKLLNEISGTKTLLIGSHFAGPVAGYVMHSKDGFIFKAQT